MADLTLTDLDRQVLRSALLAERADGVTNPLIPMDVDVTGDGVVDAWGLDGNDELVVVEGVALAGTTYVSEGDDVILSESEE